MNNFSDKISQSWCVLLSTGLLQYNTHAHSATPHTMGACTDTNNVAILTAASMLILICNMINPLQNVLLGQGYQG